MGILEFLSILDFDVRLIMDGLVSHSVSIGCFLKTNTLNHLGLLRSGGDNIRELVYGILCQFSSMMGRGVLLNVTSTTYQIG